MGLYEYMMLSDTNQWNDLWQNGTFLTHHIGPKQKFSLYALYDFFVEVELDVNTNKIVAKGHFKTGETLDRYAGSIDINKL
ncbi:hypothetical protein [Maribacter forsetii]|uniref:hypothetical protein n=1 Tax=Maribacter forsetii TaxID=444515 RepID=UPI00055A500E|nr:hypothetical protein [Maribacter forsetii]